MDILKTCPKCGSPVKDGSNYCSNCGQLLKNDSLTLEAGESIPSDNISEMWAYFVQKKVDYYIPKFEMFEKNNKKVSWNWASFFFGPFWFFYRKMYLYGFMFILIGLFTSGLINGILAGIFGNYLYYVHARSKIENALLKSKGLNIDPRTLLLSYGGTSFWQAVGIFILIIFILIGFFTLLEIYNPS